MPTRVGSSLLTSGNWTALACRGLPAILVNSDCPGTRGAIKTTKRGASCSLAKLSPFHRRRQGKLWPGYLAERPGDVRARPRVSVSGQPHHLTRAVPCRPPLSSSDRRSALSIVQAREGSPVVARYAFSRLGAPAARRGRASRRARARGTGALPTVGAVRGPPDACWASWLLRSGEIFCPGGLAGRWRFDGALVCFFCLHGP